MGRGTWSRWWRRWVNLALGERTLAGEKIMASVRTTDDESEANEKGEVDGETKMCG